MARKLTKPQIRKQMRLARINLHYWQMIGRMDRRAVKSDDANVRHYAAELKRLQQLENKA